jgi:phospholipid/cholesterol/gamma-HCH transport system permease protein
MSASPDELVPGRPSIRELGSGQQGVSVELTGPWTVQALLPRLDELSQTLHRLGTVQPTTWDLTGVQALDHMGAAMLWRAWGRKRAARLALLPEHDALFRRIESGEPSPKLRVRATLIGPILALGIAMLHALAHVRDVLVILGAIAIELSRLSLRPTDMPWREISANIYRTGAQALGITALVGFLIGVVLSYLTANQLKTFGADVFLVNILGISITRELGPVLAAILVAGRSGSSMTAQLGVMRVTQELDALSVMGIGYTTRLVLPKVLGLAVALPLLVVWTNALALLGGMVAAHAELGISYLYFIESLPGVVPIENVWLGVGKGAVFGVLIALLACHFGLRIRPNTESLGAGTTSSVVTAITIVILVDAVFAIVFRGVGLGF